MAATVADIAYWRTAMTRPMPLLDLGFLLLDRPETPANVGALLLLDVPAGRSPAAIANRIARAYRAARPGHPFDCVPDLQVTALPQWRPADSPDMRRHVLRETLEPPGDFALLCRQVARHHEQLLERTRPLFAVHVIDGLASGQLAVYIKSHHANWDGRYALERILGHLRPEPGLVTPPFFAAADGHEAVAASGDLAAGLATGVRAVVTQAAAARELIGRLSSRASAGDGARASGNRPFAGPATRFSEPVRPGRAFAGFSLPLADLRRIARICGGTLNDVALTVVDAGVERLLTSLGERPRQPLVAMCPVSLRDPGDHEATTKAATLFVPLAQPRSGALDRLRQIVAHSQGAKAEFRGFSHAAALNYALLAFGLWYASNALGLGSVSRPVVNLVVSNVGGVSEPRYLGSCRVAAAYPVSMLADPVGLNVTVLSLDGHMDFGILANAAVLSDAFELARACQASFATLARAARRLRT